MQIYQPDTDKLIVRVVKWKDYDEKHHEQQLLKNMRERLTGDIRIDIEYVTKIPRTSSGKLQLFVSKVVQE